MAEWLHEDAIERADNASQLQALDAELGECQLRLAKCEAERDALREALRDLRRVYDRNVDPFDACAVYDRIDALLWEEKDG